MTDTDKLLELAKAAMEARPGKWFLEPDSKEHPCYAWLNEKDGHVGFVQIVTRMEDDVKPYKAGETIADYILATNPETIIALLTRLRLAEERADSAFNEGVEAKRQQVWAKWLDQTEPKITDIYDLIRIMGEIFDKPITRPTPPAKDESK